MRKAAENRVRQLGDLGEGRFHIASLSSRTLVYKGMLLADQMTAFYPDLTDSSMASALALVHQRYSTNTFPSWDLAQPFRYLCHNGEINTLRGNINWMRARTPLFRDGAFGWAMADLNPACSPGGSDSAAMENALELLLHTVAAQLALDLDERGNIRTGSGYMTSHAGVFAAGEARRGQSLIVWAISDAIPAIRSSVKRSGTPPAAGSVNAVCDGSPRICWKLSKRQARQSLRSGVIIQHDREG